MCWGVPQRHGRSIRVKTARDPRARSRRASTRPCEGVRTVHARVKKAGPRGCQGRLHGRVSLHVPAAEVEGVHMATWSARRVCVKEAARRVGSASAREDATRTENKTTDVRAWSWCDPRVKDRPGPRMTRAETKTAESHRGEDGGRRTKAWRRATQNRGGATTGRTKQRRRDDGPQRKG